MCSTPAPPSTPFVAASIWSGTGEVNTSPAHAASRPPGPTNPPCRGSCPDPPPETIPTLPCTGASPRKTTLFSWSTRSCGCASSTPRNASVTTSAVSLISFFIGAPIGGGGLSVSYAAVTPTGTSDRERLGIGLAAAGRPAYITAGRVTDLGAERDVATFRDRTFAVLDAAYAAGIRYIDAARSYGRAEEFLAAW